MYLQFYGFHEAPFNLTPDSKFLFLSHRHQEALAALLFGVMERKGFICMTGEIGCGKTTLCRAMLAQLDAEQVKTCVVLNSYLTDLELLKTINEGYGLPASSDSKKTLLDALNEFLVREFTAGRNVVLIIDEAQNLRPETLEQIRMISNLETETAKLIQIIMLGQPELRRTLALPELEQLNQRITVRYHITPLTESEIPDYVKHRLAVAEPNVEVKFSPGAIRLIHHYSHGVPRRINVICDRCLLVGYVQGSLEIDDKIVQRAVDELRGESGGMAAPGASAASSTSAPMAVRAPGASRRFVFNVLYIFIIAAVISVAVYGGMKLALNSANGGISLADGTQKDPSSNKGKKTGNGVVVPPDEPLPVSTAPGLNPNIPISIGAAPTATPAQAMAMATATPSATATPMVLATALPTAVPTLLPTAAPTPRPAPVSNIPNWTWDRDNVLRVQTEPLAEAASYLIALRQWYPTGIDLSQFQSASDSDVAQFDMIKTVKQLNFDAYTTDKLNEALRFNLPVILRLNGSNEKLGPYATLTSMKGSEILELADPLHGKQTATLKNLQTQVAQAIVLYQDTEHWMGLSSGSTGETVAALQRWLVTQGVYQGTIDGKFGSMTHDAIEKLQAKQGLETTGALDTPTVMSIYARLNPRRPKLY